MRKLATKKFIIVFLFLCILLVPISIITIFGMPHIYFGNQEKTEENLDNCDYVYLQSLKQMIDNYYDGSITENQLNEGILEGVFGTMDSYTAYFTKEKASTYFADTSGQYCGIGISIDQISDQIVITKIYGASPAEQVGLEPGDEIIRLNDKKILGLSTDEIAYLIKGQIGTKIKLGIIKSGEATEKSIEITRSNITINPVSYDIRGDIGYIKIDNFNLNTDQYVNKVFDEFDRNKITKVILDLRNNTGGAADQAVALANKLIPKGLIAKIECKSPNIEDVEYYSSLEKVKYKLIVLINGMSKSSSELFAGAVQDRKSGILVGTKTFGKAKVQQTFPILSPEASKKYEKKFGIQLVNATDLYQKFKITASDDEIMGYAKVTIGVYYTPNGRMIDMNGIEPDVIVSDPIPVNGVNILNVQKISEQSDIESVKGGIDIYNAESILKMDGYNIGIPDTIIDNNTKETIKQFQIDRNINISEHLDDVTIKELNILFYKFILEYDDQYEKAIKIFNER